MKARISTGFIVIAILSIIFLAGFIFGPSPVSAQRGGPPFAGTTTAFEVQAGDFVVVDESDFSDPTTFFIFSHSRTPISVSDPTTGEPIDNLGLNNFAVDQLGSLQDCGLSAPPTPPTSTDGFLEKPFDIAVTNFRKWFLWRGSSSHHVRSVCWKLTGRSADSRFRRNPQRTNHW